MAVSNSIGSNVFDILGKYSYILVCKPKSFINFQKFFFFKLYHLIVGLALPFFIETTIVSPGISASINSKGLFYAMILLFLSLVVTVYLFYMNHWVLNKRLGILMIISYFVILLVSLSKKVFFDLITIISNFFFFFMNIVLCSIRIQYNRCKKSNHV